MPFPSETLKWAQETKEKLAPLLGERGKTNLERLSNLEGILGEIFKRSKEKEALETLSSLTSGMENPNHKKITAAMLYHTLQLRYGFQDSLETDNWVPWPNECKTANCYGSAIANYVVAEACGLKPVLVEFIGMQQEGQPNHRAGHSLVVVDVGIEFPEYWIIDQPFAMYGPVKIGENWMEVENLIAKKGKTHKKDYKKKTFGFIQNIATGEESIVDHVERLRSNPEVVLYPGQRISIPLADKWQSKEAVETPWYLKFIPDRSGENKGELVSRMIMDRPGIKSRGLEYKIILGKDDEIKEEKIIGYYCGGMVWVDFINPIPMMELSPEDAFPLLDELPELSFQFSHDFEMYLMEESSSSSPDECIRDHIKAARTSFETMQNSEYGNIVSAFSVVEALYQHEKGGKQNYLSSSEREQAIKRFRGKNPLFGYYVKAKRYLKQASKTKKKLEKKPLTILRPSQLESPRVRAFLSLETEEERFQHILKRKPTFVDDAIDRLVFYNRKIKGKEGKIHEMAKSTFDNYDASVFGGYVRIFGEFLGHIAVTKKYLCLDKYKEKIINKIT
ncbi:hypothetical protein ACFL0E_00850 [Nanoarchaeota archaeon]